MQTLINTTCIRCGKVRIFLRKWKDRENDRGAMVTHRTTACPDAECQKVVDAKFQEIRDKRYQAEERRKNKTGRVKVSN